LKEIRVGFHNLYHDLIRKLKTGRALYNIIFDKDDTLLNIGCGDIVLRMGFSERLRAHSQAGRFQNYPKILKGRIGGYPSKAAVETLLREQDLRRLTLRRGLIPAQPVEATSGQV
jgi:hypothetical protein